MGGRRGGEDGDGCIAAWSVCVWPCVYAYLLKISIYAWEHFNLRVFGCLAYVHVPAAILTPAHTLLSSSKPPVALCVCSEINDKYS